MQKISSPAAAASSPASARTAARRAAIAANRESIVTGSGSPFGNVSLLVKASTINAMELLLKTNYVPGVYNKNAMHGEQVCEKSR